ncbi:AAA family ATPase [Microvirga yunnanensis]|uniref:AAA family ATPase n=1 Tax=Microvirga yunnanensis TaxID=2953740 RepID=UPI0021C6C695|nr:CtpF protein [Microvirga sp. HBU65207]
MEQHADPVPVPRIAIEAFCDSPGVVQSLEMAARDRLMAKAQVSVTAGGIATAVQAFQARPTPPLIIVESGEDADALPPWLDQLAEVCDAGTKVLVVGHSNDIALYRELIKRGVSEYVVAPVEPRALIAAITGIYSDGGAGTLGQVHAFVGASGGVGSSSMAHNIGWTIGQRFGAEVVLADMDLPFGTGGLNLNLDPAQGLAEVVQDVNRLDRMLLDRLLTRYDDHLSLLAAPARLEQTYDLGVEPFEALIDVARSSVSVLVLDVPHLWTSWVQRSLILADQVVITAVPDLANLRNAKNLVGFLRQARLNDSPPKLVLNQVGVPKRPEIKPRDFADALQLEFEAIIPFEPSLFGKAANNGQMIAQVSPKSAVAETFVGIAQAVTGRKEPKRRKEALALGSLLRKLKQNP